MIFKNRRLRDMDPFDAAGTCQSCSNREGR
jgi:hypothetical protein